MADARMLRARAAKRPGLAKTTKPDQSNEWAMRAYEGAVEAGGGASEVGRREGKHESTIRARSHDDRKGPTLSQCVAGLGCFGLRELADRILDKADELEALETREEGARRAG